MTDKQGSKRKKNRVSGRCYVRLRSQLEIDEKKSVLQKRVNKIHLKIIHFFIDKDQEGEFSFVLIKNF